jgi:hypothetical protein
MPIFVFIRIFKARCCVPLVPIDVLRGMCLITLAQTPPKALLSAGFFGVHIPISQIELIGGVEPQANARAVLRCIAHRGQRSNTERTKKETIIKLTTG